MASAKCLRRSICTVIASAGTKQTEIVSELDNIFGNYESFASDWGELDDNVTPLMLACDKCCSEALIYLRTQISAVKYNSQPMKHLIEAWGHPDEASSHGNRASHHALAAGFSEGLDLLENIWGCFEEETQKTNEENSGEGSDHLRRYLSLLSQTNHNGDTPLMMACVSGHDDIVRSLLRRSVQLALNTRPDDTKASVSETWQLLKDIFNIRNGEECTALNLACGHGHPDIVKVLIEQHRLEVNSNNDFIEVNLLCGMDNNIEVNSNKDPTAADHLCCYKEKTMADEAIYTCCKLYKMNPLVDVTFTDIDFCKNTLENLATRLKFKERLSRKMIEELSFQRKNSDECLAMMECELNRLATKTANELLLLDYNSAKSTRPIISSGAKRVKIRNRQRRTTRKDSSSNVGVLDGVINATKFDDETGNDGWKHAKNEPALKCPIKSSPFITLQDGTVVSKYQKSCLDADRGKRERDWLVDAQISVLADNLCINDVNSDESKISKEAKTFQRILQSTNTLSSNDDDIAALMESLCLDPAMLLLSPHGMAIEMSPCQLDAIGTILKQQLRATKEAQQIQRRLLNKQSNA